MNRLPVSTPLVVTLFVVIGIGLFYWLSPTSPTTPPTEVAATTTSPTASTPTPAPVVKQPTSVKTPAPTPAPSRIMTASVTSGVVPFSVAFTLNVNADLKCSPKAWVLSFGDGTQSGFEIPTEKCGKPYTTTIYRQYQKAGDFTATLAPGRVGGDIGSSVAHVSIVATYPVVTVGSSKAGQFTVSPTSGSAPLTVDFGLKVSDNTGTNGVRYTMLFGDGETAAFAHTATPTLTHTFSAIGGYAVSVKRETECSASGTCTGPSTSLGFISISVH